MKKKNNNKNVQVEIMRDFTNRKLYFYTHY